MTLQLQKNRSLAEFSTFGIGGPIRCFTEVATIEEMQEAFRIEMPRLIIGKGSNSLFSDTGFDGLVILNKIDFCEWKESAVFVGSGYSFSLLGVQSARKGFSGLEFASGIPASVGGAVFMNAGANQKETSECLQSVLYLHENGSIEELRGLTFGYRKSPFQQMRGAILGATFCLSCDPLARKNQIQIVEYRKKVQPLNEKSAGCVFRNPQPTQSAGLLIDRCGLKGTMVGGAAVSDVHANFIINKGHAKAQDVMDLIALVQEKVFQQTGVFLEPEIRIFDAT